jgi:hypothetical protein
VRERADCVCGTTMHFQSDSNFKQQHSPDAPPRPRRIFARVLRHVLHPEDQRAQGMPGARRAHGPACKMKKHTSVVTEGSTGLTRHSPRNGFNGFLRALLGDRACLPLSSAELLPQDLTPASGRQDHTTSPSASRAVRLSALSASTAPRPTSVTIAKRPSVGAGRERYGFDLGKTGSGKFFEMGLDWEDHFDPLQQIPPCVQDQKGGQLHKSGCGLRLRPTEIHRNSNLRASNNRFPKSSGGEIWSYETPYFSRLGVFKPSTSEDHTLLIIRISLTLPCDTY